MHFIRYEKIVYDKIMKRQHLFTTFLLLLILTFSGRTSFAQSGTRSAPKKEKNSPLGLGVNIGNIGFYNNYFTFGLSPNVALRIGDEVAVGFMLKAQYIYERFPQYGNLKISTFNLGPTLFARYKPIWNVETATPFLRGLFIQAEYERALLARPKIDDLGNVIVEGNRIVTERPGEDYMYVGIGSSFGYPFSTFVSIHYNILDKATATRIPFDYRIGITYRY